MLENNFFYIRQLDKEDGKVQAQLELNPGHPIFEGHFPGQPVVPGVCMVQMVKEILQQSLNLRLQLQSADHIKFLSIIDPRQTQDIKAEITYKQEENEVDIVASLQKEEGVSLKLKGRFIVK